MDYFTRDEYGLTFKRRGEMVSVMAWGNGLRVRATRNHEFSGKNWALEEDKKNRGEIRIRESEAEISNGNIRAVMNPYGKLIFCRTDGTMLLKEYYRSWDYGTEDWKDLDQITMVRSSGREYRSVGGQLYHTTVRFEARDEEKIYGMGQYQHPYLDLKGCSLELEQKNTQITVPFALSGQGYGILWNNPSVGKASFGQNVTEWTAKACHQVDYWICVGNTPAELLSQYMEVTGRVAMMPEYAMGFWQCKLRYQTQEELLEVAREYYRRRIPVKVMVADFFHWPNQGEWKFDREYWPDIPGMVKELEEMGMKLMVSVWPTVDHRSENYQEMFERDLLVRTERGMNLTMDCWGMESFTDMTNPEAREFIWEKCRENYYRHGVALFWLDEAEPEYTKADWDLYRYYEGPALECANRYPVGYAKAFYKGMKEEGTEIPINLIRCAWAGSQKYGALVWSGDVPSTFTQLRNQYTAGLNMGMAGILWWTADIGGFHGGNIHDPQFHELLMRWFQYGAFCPVMRLHGDRDPHDQPSVGTSGGGMVGSGAANEVWSYPEHVENMMVEYIVLRDRMKPYITEVMKEAHEECKPVMRTLFYEFPEDGECWKNQDAYLFGGDLLVCPVMERGKRSRTVYLPKGARWTEALTGQEWEGGQEIQAAAPLERIPLFVRNRRKDLIEILSETLPHLE